MNKIVQTKQTFKNSLKNKIIFHLISIIQTLFSIQIKNNLSKNSFKTNNM